MDDAVQYLLGGVVRRPEHYDVAHGKAVHWGSLGDGQPTD